MSKRGRGWVAVVSVLTATPAWAQPAQAAPTPQPPAPTAPGAPAPAQPSQPGVSSQPGASSQPSSSGAASQQVVVNPPQAVPPPPASSTTVVTPSSGATGYAQPYGDPGVAERARERPNPLSTVALDGAYGGVAGVLVGGGVALIERDHWVRDLAVGTGLGLIVGAAVGVVQAVYDSQQPARTARAVVPRPPTVAWDGLSRTDRDPVLTARTVGFAVRF